jgi:hypothetical protein
MKLEIIESEIIDMTKINGEKKMFVNQNTALICVKCKNKFKKGQEVIESGQYIIHKQCEDVLLITI